MNGHVKDLYGKMVDYKRFAIVLLTVGVFFFLGVILPSAAKTEMELNIMIIGSLAFLAASILFFTFSKQCEMKLLDMEEDPENMNQK